MIEHTVDGLAIEALRKLYVDRKNAGVGGPTSIFPIFFIDNRHRFNWLLEILGDETSKELLCWFIQFRILAPLVGGKEKAKLLLDPLITEYDSDLLLQEANHHKANTLAGSMDVDIIETFCLGGYSLPGMCSAALGDTVIDCGAFNGNSSLFFAASVGEGGMIYAFEPIPSTYLTLEKNISKFPVLKERISIQNLGVGNKEGVLRFRGAGAASRIDPNGNIEVEVVTIDDFVEAHEIKNVSLIKMDIEGHEKQALRGAVKTIKRFRPKLMICVYHLAEDMVAIPEMILRISPWYKFYLRHHASHDGELVLYGVPKHHHMIEKRGAREDMLAQYLSQENRVKHLEPESVN